MIYVMSDLHGCYEEYLKALDIIGFNCDDVIYVLGDVLDRGDGGLKILNHMMMFDNIIPLIGNHEVMAMSLLRKLCTEITEETLETTLTEDDMISLDYWCHDGGNITLNQFQKLDRWDQEMFLDYLDEFLLYEEVSTKTGHYVLMHAGISDTAKNKTLDEMRVEDLVFMSTDVSLKGKVLVCGHTPTQDGKIHFQPDKISIDCGCIFGGNLGILCLDTLESYYVKRY